MRFSKRSPSPRGSSNASFTHSLAWANVTQRLRQMRCSKQGPTRSKQGTLLTMATTGAECEAIWVAICSKEKLAGRFVLIGQRI